MKTDYSIFIQMIEAIDSFEGDVMILINNEIKEDFKHFLNNSGIKEIKDYVRLFSKKDSGITLLFYNCYEEGRCSRITVYEKDKHYNNNKIYEV
jgi:hypothetical protein